MDRQKTLIISIKQDVSHANETQIEAIKALWRATFEPCGLTPIFEIREIDPMARLHSMLRLVRSEYEVNSDGTPDSIEVVAEGERHEDLFDEL